MIETSLVHIYPLDDRDTFVGCGAIVEGAYIATCRHVWRDAGGEAAEKGSVWVKFPRSFGEDGDAIACQAELENACDDIGARPPDLVLLRPLKLPHDVMALQIARHERFEHGEAFAHAILPSRNFTDEAIDGTIVQHVNANGLRRFKGKADAEYWLESGSSGSPVFLKNGQQLAGLVSLAELGPRAQTSSLREAFVVRGQTIWSCVGLAQATPIAKRENVDIAQFRRILASLGQEDVPASEIPAKLEAAIEEMKARAAEPVAPSNEGEDINATVAAARAKLDDLDPQGALAILKKKRAEAAEERKCAIEREIRLLEEQAAIERMAYEYVAAKATLEELLRLDSEQVWRWIDLGDLWQTTGPLDEAAKAYRAAGDAARRTGNERDIGASYDRVGEVQFEQGDLVGALKSYQDGHAIAGALKSYQDGHAIAGRLATSDPGNAGWQRDLAVSFGNLGLVYRQSGDATRALDALRQGRAIMSRLTELSPNNAQWRRDLAVFDRHIGELAPQSLDGSPAAETRP